jgi:uncharacterized membrane protein
MLFAFSLPLIGAYAFIVLTMLAFWLANRDDRAKITNYMTSANIVGLIAGLLFIVSMYPLVTETDPGSGTELYIAVGLIIALGGLLPQVFWFQQAREHPLFSFLVGISFAILFFLEDIKNLLFPEWGVTFSFSTGRGGSGYTFSSMLFMILFVIIHSIRESIAKRNRKRARERDEVV